MSDALAARLRAAGLPDNAVVWAPPGDDPSSPPPPEGPWLLVPYGERVVVGALGRARFAPYESLWNDEDAIDLAVRLAASPLPLRRSDVGADERVAGDRTSTGILERAAEQGGAPAPTRVRPGDLLDCFGLETGHHLYALGTPFPNRSQPPSDVGAPYLTFEVVRPFPEQVREGVAAPWFEQPGGGAMVVLDRPIRWYADQGALLPRV